MTEAVFCPTDDEHHWRAAHRRRGFRHGFVITRDPLSGRWIRHEVTPDQGIRSWSPPEYDPYNTATALAGALQAAGHAGAVPWKIDDRPRRRWFYLFRSSTMGLHCHILGVKRVAKPWSLYRLLRGEKLPWGERWAQRGVKWGAVGLAGLAILGWIV